MVGPGGFISSSPSSSTADVTPAQQVQVSATATSKVEMAISSKHGSGAQGGVPLRIDALILAVAVDDRGGYLLLENCQHLSHPDPGRAECCVNFLCWPVDAPRRVVWDLDVGKGLVRGRLPGSEPTRKRQRKGQTNLARKSNQAPASAARLSADWWLGAGEEVVQRLRIGGCRLETQQSNSWRSCDVFSMLVASQEAPMTAGFRSLDFGSAAKIYIAAGGETLFLGDFLFSFSLFTLCFFPFSVCLSCGPFLVIHHLSGAVPVLVPFPHPPPRPNLRNEILRRSRAIRIERITSSTSPLHAHSPVSRGKQQYMLSTSEAPEDCLRPPKCRRAPHQGCLGLRRPLQ